MFYVSYITFWYVFFAYFKRICIQKRSVRTKVIKDFVPISIQINYPLSYSVMGYVSIQRLFLFTINRISLNQQSDGRYSPF